MPPSPPLAKCNAHGGTRGVYYEFNGIILLCITFTYHLLEFEPTAFWYSRKDFLLVL